MRHRILQKLLVIAASSSVALSPIPALANQTAVLNADEASQTTEERGKKLLNRAITYAEEAQKASSYTSVVPKVKAYLDAKLTAARAVSQDTAASTTQINQAWAKLTDAVHYLDFTGDHTTLAALIAQHEDKVESDYKSGWAEFDAALKAAQAVNADANALQEDIDTKKTALEEAVSKLVTKDPVIVNKAELVKAIEDAGKLNEADYTADSWAALDVALDAATMVNEDPDATQDEVDAAVKNLQDALNGLTAAQPTLNLEALEAAVQKADAVKDKEAEYTVESWTLFKNALDEAVALLADSEDKTQEEVNLAAKALTDAQAALEKKAPAPEKVDKTALKEALDEAAGKKETDYTADSWTVFNDAKNAAQAVYENETATSDEVLKAKNDLLTAMQHLAEKPAPVDKSALKDALDKAALKNETDYTAESWLTFDNAKKAAQTVCAKDDATSDEVLKATNDLLQATKDLVDKPAPVDKAALKDALDEAAAKNQADYTADSWTAFQNARQAAQTIFDKSDASANEVLKATNDLLEAMNNLEDAPVPVEKSALAAAIENAQKLKESDYTAASWSTLADALAAANAVNTDASASQAQVNEAVANLKNAVDALCHVPALDLSELEAAILEADAVRNKEADYTADSWSVFTDALTAAEGLSASHDGKTQEEINEAAQALRNAQQTLVKKDTPTPPPVIPVDKSALESALQTAATKQEEDYTADSWNAFIHAQANAQKVLDQEDATNDEVEAATTALQAAIDGLKAKEEPTPPPAELVDKSALQAAIDGAEKLNAADYIADSWAVLASALDAANRVNNDPDAERDAVNTALADLNAALNQLRKPQSSLSLEVLQNAIVAAKKDQDKEADYTPDSWKAFKDALDAANALMENSTGTTQKEINDAAAALGSAQAALTRKNEPTPPAPENVDKSTLKKALDAAGKLKEADYTADSWKKFVSVKEAAQKIYDKEDASKDEVLRAANDLLDAMDSLMSNLPADVKVDKTKLAKALTATRNLNEKKPDGDRQLSENTYKALQEAFKKADSVSKNDNATQDEVDKATAALNEAYENLDQTIWRVYNPNNGEHLFTANKGEYDMLVGIKWQGEGKAWIAPRIGGRNATNMTRLYNPNSGEHHYTATPGEIANLEKLEWKNEGTKWAVYVSEKDAKDVIAVHRMYNPNAHLSEKSKAGPHHYTLDSAERDHLVKVGWNWEHLPEDIFYAKAKAPK